MKCTIQLKQCVSALIEAHLYGRHRQRTPPNTVNIHGQTIKKDAGEY